jgi:glyoxylate reductase
MLKKKVLVTRKLPDEAMRLLYEICEVELNPYDRAMAARNLIAGLAGELPQNCVNPEVFGKAEHS